MRLSDYLRLGFTGVKAHKKRAVAVVVIVGLLFGVIVAGTFTLQGIENVVMSKMLAPTDGKVLVASNVDTAICRENCDILAETTQIRENIRRYGGEVMGLEIIQTKDGAFYKLRENIFDSINNNIDDDEVLQVAVPLKTAVNLVGTQLPNYDAAVSAKLDVIEEVREKTLHKVIESKTGEKYYIAEILPGGVYGIDLSLVNVEQKGNPLDAVLGQVRTGTSQDFIAKSVGDEVRTDAENMGIVLAQFSDVKTAYDYYQDEANYCAEMDRIFGACGENYKYQVFPAVSDPLTTYENLQSVWLVFRIAVVVLVVIAVIIALSTYARLMGKDMKVIALYHAMGATGRQIWLVYVTYLLILSLMAVAFALVVGLALAVGLSLANMTALEQVFTLGFGIETEQIWLIGWNNLIWCIAGAMVLVAFMAVVLGNGNFRAKELAKKLK